MGEQADDSLEDWLLMQDIPLERAINFDAARAPLGSNDWHRAWNETEPRCGADQWRTRDREVIVYMHEMTDSHLGHCIRFASTKPQHASRLSSLLTERARRADAATKS
jgi:hypothetical protein